MRRKLNARGYSFIELMVGIAIFSISVVAFSSMISSQNTQIEGLNQKFAAMNFQSLLQLALADGSICTKMLTTPTPLAFTYDPFSTNSIADITLNSSSLPSSSPGSSATVAEAGQPVSPLNSRLTLQSRNPFQITNIKNSGVNKFTAAFQASYDNSILVRALKPASATILFTTSNVGNTHRITKCEGLGGTSSSSGCTFSFQGGNLVETCASNVGLGTDSPNSPLDISANTPTNVVRIRNQSLTGWSSIDYYSHAGVRITTMGHGNPSAPNYPDASYMNSDSSKLLAFGINGVERFRLASNGNVGIGTQNPGELLEVNGNL